MGDIYLNQILISAFTTTALVFIYYQILAKPIIKELKEIKEKLTQLTQKEEKKSKDE